MSYDRALTTFSPSGELLQLEYALESIKYGSTLITIKTQNALIFSCEAKPLKPLQEKSHFDKISFIDDHLVVGLCGLSADSRVILNFCRSEAQNYRLTYAVPPPASYIAKSLGERLQKVTQKGGQRPFGTSIIIGEIDPNETNNLIQIEPSGMINYYKANCVGKNNKVILEILEKEYKDNMRIEEGLKLCGKAMNEIIEDFENNVEIAVFDRSGLKFLTLEDKQKIKESLNN